MGSLGADIGTAVVCLSRTDSRIRRRMNFCACAGLRMPPPVTRSDRARSAFSRMLRLFIASPARSGCRWSVVERDGFVDAGPIDRGVQVERPAHRVANALLLPLPLDGPRRRQSDALLDAS